MKIWLTIRYCINIFLLVIISLNSLTAQTTYNINGTIIDIKTGAPIDMAIVGIEEINQWVLSNIKGEFFISNIPKGNYTIKVSCISYKPYSESINVYNNIEKNINLSVLDNILKEIVVIAKESKGINTSSVINKDAISHLQPSSFSELLELLPGNSSRAPYLAGVNIVSMRQVGSDMNTSLGTSFIIDGAVLSNDANLQNISGSWERKVSKRNSTGYGIDMRTISTDDIESVDIVRGIPSVEFGGLNSGLINIHRKKGYSPYRIRAKADPNSKLLYFGKGIMLSSFTSINIGLDYLDYKVDPRNELENYKRITSSVRYNSKIEKNNNLYVINLNIDYTGSFDDEKKDVEINYGFQDYYKSSHNNYRISSSVNWENNNNNYIKGITYRISSSYTYNQQIRNKLVSQDRDIPWTSSKKTGVNDGIYLPNEYQSYLEVDAKPINLYSQLSSKINVPLLNIDNSILVGLDYKYDKNIGEGEIFNPNRPAYLNTSRPRRYIDVPSQNIVSFFLENNMSIPLVYSNIELRAGLRGTKLLNICSQFDNLNKLFIEPRINASWGFPEFEILNKPIKININAGYGEHMKFPTLSHLYPNLKYLDLVQLNYYHINSDYRRVNFKTYIINPTNYKIRPANNKKIEIRLDLNIDNNNFSITAFNEHLSSGFRSEYNYESLIYNKYNNQSVDYNTLKGKPQLDKMTFERDTSLYLYSTTGNGGLLVKEGIEFQFDFNRIKSLHTKLTINGAWLRTTYSNSMPVLVQKNEILNGKTINYIGEYDWDNGYTRERLNTNFRFDTQIPNMGLIFSCLIECEWYQNKQSIKKDNRPLNYIDKYGVKHLFTKESEDDYRLNWLVLNFNENTFMPESEPFSAYINLKITKKFNSNISLSMYVNRVLNYLPTYERNGFEIKRRSSPYFGMELNIEI